MRLLPFLFTILISPLAFSQPTAILCRQVIDGHADKPLNATVVVVENNKIKAVGNKEVIPSGATIIDLKDHTLMPGFIDLHCHPLGDGDDDYQTYHLKNSSAGKALQCLSNVQGLLNAGWTSLRVAGRSEEHTSELQSLA